MKNRTCRIAGFADMELKEFIENALVDIVEGVKAAQERCNDEYVKVSPGKIKGDAGKTNYEVQKVEFNVVLGTDSSNKKTSNGAIQVILSSIGLGFGQSEADIRKGSEQTTVRFTIPVRLPVKK